MSARRASARWSWLAERAPVVAVCVVAAVLRFWRLGAVALVGDESYYWLWSERLAPAYLDNAAGVAFMVRASTLLGGQSEVGIRWLNALLGVGAVYLAYALGARLFSRRAGLMGAACLAVGAPFLVVSRFVYTDALQMVLLLLNMVLLAPLVVGHRDTPAERPPSGRPAETWRFWAVGLSMAALFNSKYNAYLYALAVLAFLLVRRRSLFSDRRTWLALGIAACGLLPVLIWNAGHDWASFRWQFQHFGTGTVFRAGARTKLVHAFDYLTPPLALLGALGVMQFRGPRRQMLWVPALALILPILLGPTDSPRNLLVGLALLLVLAGDFLVGRLALGKLAWAMTGVLLLWAVAYGLGTVIETVRPTALPSSTVARAIRVDGAGWRTLGPRLAPGAELYTLDYSIASQIRYYTARDAQTSWGQYRLWGQPAICGPGASQARVQILALGFLDPDFVSQRLRQAFRRVEGPSSLDMGEGKVLRIWSVGECAVDQATFVERFDFLSLVQAGGGR